MKDKKIHFIIGQRGYGKAYHEFIEKIKELEKEKDYLNKQNRRLNLDYVTFKKATDMYKKQYEKLLEENEELKEKINKAIKHIKKHIKLWEHDSDYTGCYDYYLLKILDKGE